MDRREESDVVWSTRVAMPNPPKAIYSGSSTPILSSSFQNIYHFINDINDLSCSFKQSTFNTNPQHFLLNPRSIRLALNFQPTRSKSFSISSNFKPSQNFSLESSQRWNHSCCCSSKSQSREQRSQ